MMDTREMTPGDRRELRAIVKKQFAVLRGDVKRRKDELTGEIEAELLARYRQQDDHIREAARGLEAARRDYDRAAQAVVDALRDVEPTVDANVYNGRLLAQDPNRQQLHRALIASIPQQIADANTKLDQQELSLLKDLTVGALDSEQAQQFLGQIPTVGELVPKARLNAIEGGS